MLAKVLRKHAGRVPRSRIAEAGHYIGAAERVGCVSDRGVESLISVKLFV